MRLSAAILTLCAVVCFAAFVGPGREIGPALLLTALFLAARRLPPRGGQILLRAMLWLSVAVAILAVAQALLWMPRARGIFASPNFLGGYAVLMFFLGLQCREESRRRRHHLQKGTHRSPPGRATVCAANLVSIALSQSRGALIALAVGLAVYGPMRRKHRIQLGALALVAALIIAHYRPQETRVGIWRVGTIAALQRPLLGWGPGGVEVGTLRHFYNIPLDLFLAAGIVGLASGAWLIVEAWRAAKPHPALRALIAAWLVNGLFIFATPATAIPFALVLARLGLKQRHVKDGAGVVDDGQPLLDRGVRAHGAD